MPSYEHMLAARPLKTFGSMPLVALFAAPSRFSELVLMKPFFFSSGCSFSILNEEHLWSSILLVEVSGFRFRLATRFKKLNELWASRIGLTLKM